MQADENIKNSKARKSTKTYHAELYGKYELFSKGSWLEAPHQEILEITDRFLLNKKNIKILDLGSGVGRNAIPIAEKLKNKGVKIDCVDYLETAIKKLLFYAKKYKVRRLIKGYISECEKFIIKPNYYDFIIAHSVLAHVLNKIEYLKMLDKMTKGTKRGGINYIYDITDPLYFDSRTGEKLPDESEVYLTFDECVKILRNKYKEWNIINLQKIPYEERYEEKGKMILWKTNYLFFVAQKS